jgi:hypothetical protein
MKTPSDLKSGTSAGAVGPPSIPPVMPRKLGADHADSATHARKHHSNFKQSADIREDRGVRQMKVSPKGKH